MTTPAGENRDLVLAQGTYAYVQVENTGQIKTAVGPMVVTFGGQEKAVKYDPDTRMFHRCDQNVAVRQFELVQEGDYVVLENPAASHPEIGGARAMPTEGLQMGHRINIPGPCNFALWPGQKAKIIKGHHLRSNQYLVARVYNPVEAQKGWAKTIRVPAGEDPMSDNLKPHTLSMGQLLIIRGDEVSFYIPPTGIEVRWDEKNKSYVREAVTLEVLEYCILVDENGKSRYEYGPAVVFPKPTEKFLTDKNGEMKWRYTELTPLSAVHVKVIADYKEEDGNQRRAGDELFITGQDCPLYRPRPEHSLIKYGGQERHFATAIPRGEGRYVMDRISGEIATVGGPKMLLPDPRQSVLIRRIMTPKEVRLIWPGNTEAAEYNRMLAEQVRGAGSTEQQGYISESQYADSLGGKSYMMSRAAATAPEKIMGSSISRRTEYTKPRTITLDTKYDGVPCVNVWTGYAVQLVNKAGDRKVVEGPASILLDYDQTLEPMQLSKGKPKTTDQLEETVYLRVRNNKVSDIVEVETSDHVPVKVKISLRVNFEGDKNKWFDVENYVKLLCDHVRSVLKGVVKQVPIEVFYNNNVPIIRDAILGPSKDGEREGMHFEENGMVVRDVEILGFEMQNIAVAELLNKTQFDMVQQAINLQTAQKRLETTVRIEEINRKEVSAKAETELHRLKMEEEKRSFDLKMDLTRLEAEQSKAEQRHALQELSESIENLKNEADIARSKARTAQELEDAKAKQSLKIAELKEQVEATCKRFEAAKGGLSEALLALNRDDVAVKMAQAWSFQSIIGGENFVDAAKKVFEGTPLAPAVAKLTQG